MNTIILACVLFLEVLHYMIIADVILSWLTLMGIRFRPRFLAQLLDPLYILVRAYIPTRIGMFDLTPIIILFGTLFLKAILLASFPEVSIIINSIGNR